MGGSHLIRTVRPVTSLLLFTMTGTPTQDRKWGHDYRNVFNSVGKKELTGYLLTSVKSSEAHCLESL